LAVAITDFIQRLVFIYPVSHPGRGEGGGGAGVLLSSGA
jgi:hypothetical protein